MTTFNYTIAAVNLSQLEAEIRASAITIALLSVTHSGGSNLVVDFKANLPTEDKTVLDNLVSSHTPVTTPDEPPEVLLRGLDTTSGTLDVTNYPSGASRVNFITHRWNDKTTWYSMSVSIQDEIPVPMLRPGVPKTGGDPWTGKYFKLAHTDIIDMTHGKLFMENYLTTPAGGGSYAVSVKVNANTLQEVHPDTGEGDWRLNYSTGMLEMNPNVAETDVITVSYHYATTSEFEILADPGKTLAVRNVEVQFTRDISLRDTMQFTALGYVGAFAPQLIGTPKDALGNLFTATDHIPLRDPVEYRTFYDYVNESNGVFPVTPETTNNNPTWRDCLSPVTTFPWDYQIPIDLYGDAGMKIQIKLKNHTPFAGEFATATFYCWSKES